MTNPGALEFRCPKCGEFITTTFKGELIKHEGPRIEARRVMGPPDATGFSDMVTRFFVEGRAEGFATRAEAEAHIALAPRPAAEGSNRKRGEQHG